MNKTQSYDLIVLSVFVKPVMFFTKSEILYAIGLVHSVYHVCKDCKVYMSNWQVSSDFDLIFVFWSFS